MAQPGASRCGARTTTSCTDSPLCLGWLGAREWERTAPIAGRKDFLIREITGCARRSVAMHADPASFGPFVARLLFSGFKTRSTPDGWRGCYDEGRWCLAGNFSCEFALIAGASVTDSGSYLPSASESHHRRTNGRVVAAHTDAELDTNASLQLRRSRDPRGPPPCPKAAPSSAAPPPAQFWISLTPGTSVAPGYFL